MAYASLVSLSQTIHKFLCDQDQYPISPHENHQIISIHECVILFQAFLEDYSEKASSLEGQMRDAANEAEDIIEYFMWKQIDQWQNHTSELIAEPEHTTEVSHQRGMGFHFNRCLMQGQIDLRQNYTSESTAGHESTTEVLDLIGNLKKVAEEIETIATEVMEIQNSTRIKDVQQLTDSSSVATSSSRLIIASNSIKSDTEMVGFQDKLMAIKERLCGQPSKLQVIPIFGMGGVGKTTLAKNAYNDQLIMEHFHIRAWVTVSQDYNTPQILSSLVVSIGVKDSQGSDKSTMFEIVYKSLKGRRYLIVMDDMWSTKAWDDVRRIFPDDRNGSRVVLTTRLLDVAAYPNSSSPLHARFMNDEESWKLLRKKVFQSENCPPELVDIGKTIGRSCGGLPLAILVIAGLVSTVSQTPASWKNIKRNVIEAITTNDEQFAETVLSFSYNHLPHHLRPCFPYMSIYPEDYEICVSELIRLWVAEGFLKLPNGSKSCEEVAEEYLEELVKRSLILTTMRNYNGKIKRCSMHDLVRDLCIKKAEQEKFFVHVKHSEAFQENMINQRRVNIAHSANLGKIKGIYGPPIHTIVCTKKALHTWKEYMWETLQYTRLLRVLNVRESLYGWCTPHKFRHISKLFHLRYLCLPYNMTIPAHISNLENLQTLIIYGQLKSDYEKATVCLEFEVWRMLQLRHLVSVSYFDGLTNPEATGFPLENLQTLLHVKNFKCTKEILLMIPNIKKLGICYFDRCYGVYQLQNLQYLHQLEKLTLEFKWPAFVNSRFIKLVFPTTLKKLTLSNCLLSWKNLGILVASLPNLEVLKLRDNACVGEKWKTNEREFLQLKFLEIDHLHFDEWITESSHFPRLKWLVLRHCFYLAQIPDDIGEISTLELIEVDQANGSLLDSAKSIQAEQQLLGNDALQFHFIRAW